MASDAAVQVLTERVSNLLDDIREMKGQLTAVNQGVVVMASLQERVNTLDSKTNRLVDLHDTTRLDIERMSNQLHSHGRMWRILGAGVLACLGMVSWAGSQFQAFHDLMTRVTVLERTAKEQTK